jgi:hypothetical protein
VTAVLNLLIPILAGVAAIAGIYFLIQAFFNQSAETRASYNVARQHAHHDKQVDLIRSVFSFIVALILLGVYGFTPQPSTTAPTVTPTPTPTTAVTTPATSPHSIPTQPVATSPAISPTATTAPTSTPTPTMTITAVPPTTLPTDTPTAAPRTATVSSGVGVWLRAEPNTSAEQLEWLLDGTILTVLPETATGENLAWQQVQTAEGLVGWVAVPFITFSE